MKRAHAFCLTYNDFSYVEEAVKLFNQQNSGPEIATKLIVDCNWPLGDMKQNTKRLMALADECGWQYMKLAKNLGMHKNWNAVLTGLDLVAGDVLVGVDSDARPQQAGWVKASLEVFEKCPEIYTVQLNRSEIFAEKRAHPFTERKVGSQWILDYHDLISWSIGSFDCGWLRRVGGMQADSERYGYVEHAMSRATKPFGGKFAILRDYYDVHLKAKDESYTKWKLESAYKRTTADFADWLKTQ